jgi:hypothetical protein
MNPYLEQDDAWRDFHGKVLPAISERLVPQVVPNYIVKMDEHIYVHDFRTNLAAFSGGPMSSWPLAQPIVAIVQVSACSKPQAESAFLSRTSSDFHSSKSRIATAVRRSRSSSS